MHYFVHILISSTIQYINGMCVITLMKNIWNQKNFISRGISTEKIGEITHAFYMFFVIAVKSHFSYIKKMAQAI